ncbi:MAG: putative transposase [Desulforhopalus sp.]|jgi:putative transposase
MSVRGNCRLLGLSRSVYQYQPDLNRDYEVIVTLSELVEKYPRYGFPKLYQMIRRKGLR